MQDHSESIESGIIPEHDLPPRDPTSPGSKIGLWIGLMALFIPLIIYIDNLCPTVFVGDAGDFLTASYTLGVPHPPGYPVYTLLGHLFMNLPIPGGISAPAFRMNMMSAIAAWGACVFMFLFLRRIIKTEWAALAGALVLAFSRQFWEHAEVAEVYTLQIFFLTLIFYLAVLYVQEKKVGWALFMAFIMGLAISHQYAILLFYPGVLIFIGINGGLRIKWHIWLLAICLAILGLVPYVYLPIVKFKTPLGEVVFVDTPEQAAEVSMDKIPIEQKPHIYLWKYFSRQLYSDARKYTHTEEVLQDRTTTPMVFRKTLETTREDFEIPLILFGIVGWIAMFLSLFRRKKGTDPDSSPIPTASFLPPALGYILYFLVVHFYPSGDILAAPLENLDVVIPPLLIPLQASLAMIIALGFDTSLRWIHSYVKSQGMQNVASSQKFRAFAFLLVIAAFTLTAVNLRNVKFCDKSDSVISYNYAINVLDSCDEDAILLTTGDETFLFWYLQHCEPSRDPDDPSPGYRKDILAINWIHNLPGLDILRDEPHAMAFVTERFILSSTYYKEFLDLHEIDLILPHYGARPINSTFVSSSFAESNLIMALDVVLQGLTYSFRTPGDIPDVDLPEVCERAGLESIEIGAAPMSVIDYFDARPFESYNYEGLPRFEGSMEDLSQIANAFYLSVNLEAQELEVLGRYQDALYRFGIQHLLQDNGESAEAAVNYLFRCVSLDPDDFFGWKELGDAFFSMGNLQSAGDSYMMLLELGRIKGDIDPNLLAGCHAQIGHIELIHGNIDAAESDAHLALMLNPDDKVARAILNEIDRQREKELEEVENGSEEIGSEEETEIGSEEETEIGSEEETEIGSEEETGEVEDDSTKDPVDENDLHDFEPIEPSDD